MFRKTIYPCILFAIATAVSLFSETRHFAQSQEEPDSLVPRKPIEREIAPRQTHSFRLTLAKDQYARINANQLGVDIAITIFAPDGEKILTVDAANGRQGKETASTVAATAGVYCIEIRTSPSTSGKGRFALSVTDLREATEKDRQIAAAERAFAEAEELRKDSRYAQAIEKYQASIPHWQAAGDVRGEADAFSTMGHTHNRLGENRKSLEISETALRLSREANDKVIEGDTLNNIGLAYRMLGELQKALDYYIEALDVFRPLGDRGREAVVLGNIGAVYRMLGELDDALTYYSQSLDILRAEKDLRREANALNNRGLIYFEMGVVDQSNYLAAIDHFDQVLAIAKQLKDKSREALALQNKGDTYRVMGQTEAALDLLNQALKIRRETGQNREEGLVFHAIGLAYQARGQIKEALASFARSMDLAIQTGDTTLQANVLAAMAQVERDRGNPIRARELTNNALHAIESMRAGIASPDLRASYLSLHRKSYDFHIDLLVRLHRAEPQAGYDALALKASESVRARALIDKLSEIRADLRKGADPMLLEREQRLQQKLDGKGVELIKMSVSGSKSAKTIEDEIAQLRRELQQVVGRLRISNPRYFALAYPQPLGLKEIRERVLDADTMLLEYAFGEERSYLFTVTEDRLHIFTLPKREEVEKAASKFLEKIAARGICKPFEEPLEKSKRIAQSDVELSRAAQELSRMIIEPAASVLNRQRLLIVGDGELNLIPFGALPIPKSVKSATEKNHIPPLLVREFEIVHLPSASSLVVLRNEIQGRATPQREMAIFADPVFSAQDPRVKLLNSTSQQSGAKKKTETSQRSAGQSALLALDRTKRSREAGDCGDEEFERLVSTRKEAMSIAKLAPRTKRKLALDFDADQTAVTGEKLSQYRYIHFATHGLLDRHPELSGLALSLVDRNGNSQDGFLRLVEIFKLKLSADLVTLSACETGLGKSLKAEGIVGMTQGFFAAGAARVMVSLWKVEDEATAQLMIAFYRNLLRDHLSPAASLRKAQLNLIEQRPDLPPYFWAGFVIQGEPK